jgi:hypothetical protein
MHQCCDQLLQVPLFRAVRPSIQSKQYAMVLHPLQPICHWIATAPMELAPLIWKKNSNRYGTCLAKLFATS